MTTTPPRDSCSTINSSSIPHPGLLRAAIATILDRELDLMRRDDLIDMIRISAMTINDGRTESRFEELGDPDLTRLAYLVRRCCRSQMDAHRQQRGQAALWSEVI